ncbi:MAG TPA: phosphotransferase [Gaiellales bacterium]|nr:phosphotransferase [Gaiellales bacterium]
MRTQPTDLDRADLAAALAAGWGLEGAELTYVPEGAGSHHWRCRAGSEERFVSVDDLAAATLAAANEDAMFALLERAYGTAGALRDDAALGFVVSPIPDGDGRRLRRLGPRYAVRVAPVIAGSAGAFDDHDPETLGDVAALVAELHGATGRVPAGLPAVADLRIPWRAELETALAEVAEPWTTGPLAEPARALLAARAGEVAERLGRHDAETEGVLGTRARWVVTHGEPHPGNVIRDPAGGLHLIDWDTAMIAPRERDLQAILGDDDAGWDDYRAVAGAVEFDRDALGLYRRMWPLTDIASYVTTLRRPHEETEDTHLALEVLVEYLG